MQTETPALQRRELWPDVMRGILILLVLFHHTAAWGKLLYTPFFMTGFFFISGYFHSADKSFIQFFIGKFKGLMIPFFVLGYLFFLPSAWPHSLRFDVFYHWFLLGDAYWFIPCLFIAHLIQYGLTKLPLRHPVLHMLTSCAVCVTALYFSDYFKSYPWHTQVACVMQPFMMLGYLSRRARLFNFSRTRNIITCCIFALLYTALVSWAFFIEHAPWCDLAYFKYGNTFLFIPLSLFGTLFLAYFSASIADGQRLLSLIGRHTLVIYITHGLFIFLLSGAVSVLFRDIAHMPWRPIDMTHPGAWNIACMLFIAGATAAGLTTSYLLQHYLPWVLGKFHTRHSK